MIVDTENEPVEVDAAGPVSGALLRALHMSDVRFELDAGRAGVDLLCLRGSEGAPNRARIKIFTPRSGTTVAFVYKDSQSPLSTDRFAYGALVLKNRPASDEETVALIEYLASGFHPELRPPTLKRAFPFDVPR